MLIQCDELVTPVIDCALLRKSFLSTNFFNSYCVAIHLGWSAQMCTWSAGWQLNYQPNILPSCQAKSRTAILLWSWWTVVSVYVVGQNTHALRGLTGNSINKERRPPIEWLVTISHRQQGKWQPQFHTTKQNCNLSLWQFENN